MQTQTKIKRLKLPSTMMMNSSKHQKRTTHIRIYTKDAVDPSFEAIVYNDLLFLAL